VRERLDDLLAILAETGDAAELRKAHRTLAEIAVDLGEVAVADAELQRATAAVGGQIEDQWNKAACAVLTAEALFLRGDVRGSHGALGRAGALADHDPKSRARVALVRTVLAVHAGQLGSAIAHARGLRHLCGRATRRGLLEFLLDVPGARRPGRASARRRWLTTTPCAAASLGAAALDAMRVTDGVPAEVGRFFDYGPRPDDGVRRCLRVTAARRGPPAGARRATAARPRDPRPEGDPKTATSVSALSAAAVRRCRAVAVRGSSQRRATTA
jgi:hypothetical protein